MELTEDSKVKQTERELKLHLFKLLFVFLSTSDYGELMTMKHFSTNKVISILCSGADLQGESILRCAHDSGLFLPNHSVLYQS